MKEEEVVITVLTVQGLVQGVGFRPFIYRIANEMGICGEVDNRNNGVCIRAVHPPDNRFGKGRGKESIHRLPHHPQSLGI